STNDTTPTIKGTLDKQLEEGHRLFLYRVENASSANPSLTDPTTSAAIAAGDCIGEVLAFTQDAGGNWTWSYNDTNTLANGKTYSYFTKIVDDAGIFSAASKDNTGGPTNGFDVVVDTTPPGALTITKVTTDTWVDFTDPNGKGDVVSSAVSNIVPSSAADIENADLITRDNQVVLVGTSASNPNGFVEISFDGGITWTSTTTDASGNWTFADPMARTGNINVMLRAIDTAHNAQYYQGAFVIDVVAPNRITAAPKLPNDTNSGQNSSGQVVTMPNGGSDGVVSGNNPANLVQNFAVPGGAEAGALIAIVSDDNKNGIFDYGYDRILGSGIVGSVSSFAVTLPVSPSVALGGDLLPREVNLGFVQFDAAGNISRISPTTQVQTVTNDVYTIVYRGTAGLPNPNPYAPVPAAMATYTANTSPDNRVLSGAALTLNNNGEYQIYADGKTLTTVAYNNSISGTTAINAGGAVTVFADTVRSGSPVLWYSTGSANNAAATQTGTAGTSNANLVAWDRYGDGYIDLLTGNNWNGQNIRYMSNDATTPIAAAAVTANIYSSIVNMQGSVNIGTQISVVDLNKDGFVDVAFSGSNSAAGSGNNLQGDYYSALNSAAGGLTFKQTIANALVKSNANNHNTMTDTSMTWADFNNDGYVDLWLPANAGYNGSSTANQAAYNSRLYLSDGAGSGTLSNTPIQMSDSNNAEHSVAIDFDGDGYMDVVEFSTWGGDNGNNKGVTLFRNKGDGKSFDIIDLDVSTSSGANNIGSYGGTMRALDYNWDGALDIMIRKNGNSWFYYQNNNIARDGTHLHLKIVDQDGINIYMGNIVELFDASGKRVSSQVLNPQDGMINSTTGIVDFYGLKPNSEYTAKMTYNNGGSAATAEWSIQTGDNTSMEHTPSFVLSTGSNGTGNFGGTGYNDTFYAAGGTAVYNGAGGWENDPANGKVWKAAGGMDIVDFSTATGGVTVDLNNTGSQNTGFNTATFINIEGIRGGHGSDNFTAKAGADNWFEGREGNDTFNLINAKTVILDYNKITADADGGNGSDTVIGFGGLTAAGGMGSGYDLSTLGQGTAGVLDLTDLLSDYQGNATVYWDVTTSKYILDVASVNAGLNDYVTTKQVGADTIVQVDANGTGQYTDLVTLKGVSTDLADLIANNQIWIA
ncbi:beta strand repeat-containing protein, partial [Stenoxybacter acetivorans]|uniref:beta strand repeat-containing protein n=1 Tax=Stenoxybacter acetivorans TaxID=422441 RepID=UPI0005643A5C